MHRNEIIRQLHQIVDARLFGTATWPVDRENANRLHTTLLEMGLVEEVPGQANTWRNTPLGNELHIDLLEVFMGLWDNWEIPTVLERYGLMEKREVRHVWRVLDTGSDWERTLKNYVLRAHFAFYNPTRALS